MEPLDRQLQSEAMWNGQPDHDRLEYGLMAGYIIIAILAMVAGANTGIGAGLSKVIPETLPAPAQQLAPSILEVLGTSADIIAAIGLLIVATVMLYRRRRRTKPAADPNVASGRSDLPFLF